MSSKTLYIIRGVPGSGKSTLAHQLSKTVVETDDFMMVDGEYKYDKDKVYACHKKCFNKVLDYMAHGVTPIAVANTFIKKKDYKPYVDLAKEFGYDVEIKVCKGDYKNIHNVSQDRVEQMKSKFQESINSLLEMNGDVGITETIENKKQSNINDNFWKWFGNSKVVDENGNPLVVYHGTRSQFNEFDRKYAKRGFFFTTEKRKNSVAGYYAYWNDAEGSIMPCYIKLENPLIVHRPNGNEDDIARENGTLSNYDGIIVLHNDKRHWKLSAYDYIEKERKPMTIKNGEVIEYIVFDPNNIKSVKNNGNWSLNNNNIYESKEIKINDNFKKWFGNSKCVDTNGQPLIVYHGSPVDFNEFDKSKQKKLLKYGQGFYFTSNKQRANLYGEPKGFYLRINNPITKDTSLYFNLIEKISTELGYIENPKTNEDNIKNEKIIASSYTKANKIMMEKGYDGIILYDEYIVFNPNQIKSVDNNGNWSENSNNIYESFEPKINDNFKKWFGNSKCVDENGNPKVFIHRSNAKFNAFDKSKIGQRDHGWYGKGFYFGSAKQKYYQLYGKHVYKCFLRIENPFYYNEFFGSYHPDDYQKIIGYDKLGILTPQESKFLKKYLEVYEHFDSNVKLKKVPQKVKEYNGKVYDSFYWVVQYNDKTTKTDAYINPRDNTEDYAKEMFWMEHYERHIEKIKEINRNCYKTRMDKFSDTVRKMGYDGIIHADEYVVFEPNQIKSIKNNGNWSLEVDNINEEKEVIEERLFPELSDRKYNELLWFTTPNMTANAYTKFFGKEMVADRIPAKYLVTLSSNDISLKDLVEKHRKLYNAKQVKPIADYKDFNDFITDLNKSKYLSRNDKSNIAKSGAKIIKSFGDWDLYDITTWEAAKKYGSGTTWCVTDSTSDDYFKRYTNRLPFNNYQTEEDMKKSVRSLLFLINPNTDRKMAISVFKMMDYDWYNDSIDFYDEGDETFYRCSHTSKGSISSKDDIMEKISYFGDDWPDADVVEDYGVTEDFINSVNQFIKDMYRMNKEQIVEDIIKFRQKYKQLMNIKESANNSTNHSINEVLKLSGVNLTEGIVDVAKYYPKLDIETIKRLMNLDPTYNGGDQLGKYGKWILNLYNKFIKDKLAYEKWEEQKKMGNNFPPPMRKSTDRQEDFEKIPNLLKQFNVLNKKLKTNIDDIKSISELYKVVNDAKTSGLSDNSKVQKGIDLFKKSVQKGGEVVFKNSNWVILVPKTLESSVVFGKDTNWCTTATNGQMYNYYLKEHGGKYFINLNLKSGDLYQFHFESNQLMDSDDSDVEFKDTIKDESVKKFYLDYLCGQLDITKKPSKLIYIIVKNYDNVPEYIQIMAIQCRIHITDIKNPTEKVQLMAVKEYPYAIQYIKNPTEEMKLEAIKQNGNAIQYIKNPTEEMKLEAVKKYPPSIQYIKNPTEEMQLIAIKYDGYALGYIKNPTEKVQMASIKENGYSIQYIKNPTEEMKLEAVKKNGYAIEYIDNPTEEMQLIAVKQNGYAIQYIKNPTEEMQLIAVKYDSDSINLIDNPTEKVKEYVHMKTHKSTNHSINEEINEVLKLSGVTFKQDNTKFVNKLNKFGMNIKESANNSTNMTWEEFVEKVGRENEFDGSVVISKYNTSIIIRQSGRILVRKLGKNPYMKAYSNLKTFDEIYNMLVEKGFIEEQILTEAVNQHSLYHGCDLAYAVSIMIDNAMRGETIAHINGKKYQGNSLTRSLQFAKDWQEERWDGHSDELNQFWVVLELNKERLKTKYKVLPYNYWEDYFGKDYEHTVDRNGYGDQYEEFVVGRINNLRNYLDDVYLSDECLYGEYAEILAIVKRELELRGEDYSESDIEKALQQLGIHKPSPDDLNKTTINENYKKLSDDSGIVEVFSYNDIKGFVNRCRFGARGLLNNNNGKVYLADSFDLYHGDMVDELVDLGENITYDSIVRFMVYNDKFKALDSEYGEEYRYGNHSISILTNGDLYVLFKDYNFMNDSFENMLKLETMEDLEDDDSDNSGWKLSENKEYEGLNRIAGFYWFDEHKFQMLKRKPVGVDNLSDDDNEFDYYHLEKIDGLIEDNKARFGIEKVGKEIVCYIEAETKSKCLRAKKAILHRYPDIVFDRFDLSWENNGFETLNEAHSYYINDVKLYENPSIQWMKKKLNSGTELRILIDGDLREPYFGDWIVWDATEANHQKVLNSLNLYEEDYISVRLCKDSILYWGYTKKQIDKLQECETIQKLYPNGYELISEW